MYDDWECFTCTDIFWSQDDRDGHMDEYDHWPRCETCSRTFQSRSACHKHMSNVDHWAPRFECETCTREFRSQNAANQHMSSLGHWAPKIPCETCSKKFHTQSAADKHMKDLGHYRNYCRECKRGFMSENDLKTVGRGYLARYAYKADNCIVASQLQNPSWLQYPVSVLQEKFHDCQWSYASSGDSVLPSGAWAQP